ncbi:MAG TPA: hypothetical protein VM938_13310 [Acidimicrobiales bacterium]|nr:hypothetical protein [Acidimicrobiales bacterium]
MTHTKRGIMGALLALLLLLTTSSIANAGAGVSRWCSDENPAPGGTEVGVVEWPVTLGAEFGTSNETYVMLCYSTTAADDPSTAAIIGGRVLIIAEPTTLLLCQRDTSPTAIGLECSSGDPNASSLGKTLSLRISVQSITVEVDPTGAELGTPGPPACLRGVAIYTPAGTIGPFAGVGVC